MDDREREAFLERLYRDYYRSLFNKSFSAFNYDPEFRQLTEDCVQETFLRALKEAELLSGLEEPLYWLFTTCGHITASERRKLRRRRQILNAAPADEEPVDPQDAIADWMAEDDLLGKKEQLLASLTEQERAVYKAVYEEHRAAREAAASIGTTEGGVYAALRRIRKKIRQVFLSLLLWLSRHAGI